MLCKCSSLTFFNLLNFDVNHVMIFFSIELTTEGEKFKLLISTFLCFYFRIDKNSK